MSSIPVTPEKEKEILTGIGWRVDPVICDGCLHPMMPWERDKIKDLREPMLGIFYLQMKGKYGDKITKYFPKSATI